jgi:hypothetical protein
MPCLAASDWPRSASCPVRRAERGGAVGCRVFYNVMKPAKGIEDRLLRQRFLGCTQATVLSQENSISSNVLNHHAFPQITNVTSVTFCEA